MTGMQDIDQRLTKDVDRLCTDLAELIPTMVSQHFAAPVLILRAILSCLRSVCITCSLDACYAARFLLCVAMLTRYVAACADCLQ